MRDALIEEMRRALAVLLVASATAACNPARTISITVRDPEAVSVRAVLGERASYNVRAAPDAGGAIRVEPSSRGGRPVLSKEGETRIFEPPTSLEHEDLRERFQISGNDLEVAFPYSSSDYGKYRRFLGTLRVGTPWQNVKT